MRALVVIRLVCVRWLPAASTASAVRQDAGNDTNDCGLQVLDDKLRTGDIMEDGMTKVGCKQMGEEVAKRL